jgi:enoyl-CoA hydratase
VEYSDFEFLEFDAHPNGVLLVTINRPEVLNAANKRLHWEISKVWLTIKEKSDVKVVVITGAGQRAFCAGGDLDWIESVAGNPAAVHELLQETGDIVYNMLACDKIIISAINGVAIGAGLALALLADISIASEKARFGDGHVRLGLAAGDHAAIVWPILCGLARAKYYLLTGKLIEAKEAERIGLVSLCVPPDDLLQKAMEIADGLAASSQTAIRYTKRSLNNWMHLARPIFESSLALEMLGFLGEDISSSLAALQKQRTSATSKESELKR